MTDATDQDREHVARLVQRARSAMLTTTGPDGKQVSRPMGVQDAAFDGELWFFTDEGSAKVAQIRAVPEVNVSFSDERHHSWTSMSGRAELVHDRAKAEELWTPVLKAWFPDGLETAGLALLRVRPETVEYWDAPDSTVATTVGILRAAVTGHPEQDPVEQRTVEL